MILKPVLQAGVKSSGTRKLYSKQHDSKTTEEIRVTLLLFEFYSKQHDSKTSQTLWPTRILVICSLNTTQSPHCSIPFHFIIPSIESSLYRDNTVPCSLFYEVPKTKHSYCLRICTRKDFAFASL